MKNSAELPHAKSLSSKGTISCKCKESKMLVLDFGIKRHVWTMNSDTLSSIAATRIEQTNSVIVVVIILIIIACHIHRTTKPSNRTSTNGVLQLIFNCGRFNIELKLIDHSITQRSKRMSGGQWFYSCTYACIMIL